MWLPVAIVYPLTGPVAKSKTVRYNQDVWDITSRLWSVALMMSQIAAREAIRAILLAAPFRSGMENRWRLSPTRANAQPAFVLYRADESKSSYEVPVRKHFLPERTFGRGL